MGKSDLIGEFLVTVKQIKSHVHAIPERRTPVKRASSQKASVKRASSQKASVKRASSQKASVKKTSSQKASVKKASSQKASVKKDKSEKTPVNRANYKKTVAFIARKCFPDVPITQSTSIVDFTIKSLAQGEEHNAGNLDNIDYEVYAEQVAKKIVQPYQCAMFKAFAHTLMSQQRN